MKNTFKTIVVLFLSLFIASCSKNDDDETTIQPDPFEKNINEDRFSKMEIGSSQFIIPKSAPDTHIEFDYKGDSKVTKITLDVVPTDVKVVSNNEFKWTLTNHIVPAKHYEDQINPHIHYHIGYEELDTNPNAKPAEGTYKFRIIVDHEDGSKSAITKMVKVMLKFNNLEVGEDSVVKLGDKKVHLEYEYISTPNTVSKIIHKLWFKEWREDQDVEIGKWNNIEVIIDKKEFEGIINPKIHTHFDLIKNSPAGKYWATVYVTETGNSEALKMSTPFEIK